MNEPMIRLADRIRAADGKAVIDAISLDDTNARAIVGVFNDIYRHLRDGVPVIVADNVSEYYYNGSDQEYWEIMTDFPCLIPPFPRFWIEWAAPTQVRSKVYGVIAATTSTFSMSGALVTVHDANGPLPVMWAKAQDAREYDTLRAGARWVWQFQPVGYLTGGPQPDLFTAVAGDFWIATSERGDVVTFFAAAFGGSGYTERLGAQTPVFIHPALLAVTFMNLRNGALAPAALHAPEKFASRYRRRREMPLVRYHTVVVDPQRTSKPTLPSAPGDRSMPVHLVRGTLATYADEDGKRLFGKYSGTFFRPAHVRGNPKAGVGMHDYRVLAPKVVAGE